MDLETEANKAGTDEGMQVAPEPYLLINSLYCYLVD
jgi:hypothetical protein